MKVPAWLALLVILCGMSVPEAGAHYNMLLPAAASARKGEVVSFVYQWGHPFEHQLFEAPAPQALTVLAPDGKTTDLGRTLEKVTLAGSEGKKVGGYRFHFTPEQRGDYVFVLATPPIWMAEEEEFFQDTVKVVLHVQAQKAWDAAGDGFELIPLTRPYGLQPGMVFQAQARRGGKPVAGSLVEVERYNVTPPKELPPDEQITRSARTDPNGVVTATLTEPGWWCLTAGQDGGTREHDGKSYPLRVRATHWVWVDNKGKGE
jgi:cobalt/nickel transport protein